MGSHMFYFIGCVLLNFHIPREHGPYNILMRQINTQTHQHHTNHGTGSSDDEEDDEDGGGGGGGRGP